MSNSTAPSDRSGLRLAYPRETGGALELHEIPLVVGVLGDFGRERDGYRAPLRERRFCPLSSEDFARAASRGHELLPALTTLARLAEADPAIQVLTLDVTKEELAADLQARGDRSVLWRKVYEERYGLFGAEPFAMMIAGFPVTRSSADLTLLDGMARVGADAACPFIVTAAPQMFGVEQWEALPTTERLEWLYTSRAFQEWRALRERDYARFVAVTVQADAHEVAISLVRAYQERELWSDSGRRASESPSGPHHQDLSAALTQYGFLPGAIPLREACTVQRPRRYFQTERNTAAQVAMQLTNVLTASRFLQAATCIGRDSIGEFRTLKDFSARLNEWLRDYVDDATGSRGDGHAVRPLVDGSFTLRDVIGAPGKMEVVLDLRLSTDGASGTPSTRHTMLTMNPFGVL